MAEGEISVRPKPYAYTTVCLCESLGLHRNSAIALFFCLPYGSEDISFFLSIRSFHPPTATTDTVSTISVLVPKTV